MKFAVISLLVLFSASLSQAVEQDIQVVPYADAYAGMMDDCRTNPDAHCSQVTHPTGHGTAAGCMVSGTMHIRETFDYYANIYAFMYDWTNNCQQTVKVRIKAGNQWGRSVDVPVGHYAVVVGYDSASEVPTLASFELNSNGGNPAPKPQPSPTPTPPPVTNLPIPGNVPGACQPGVSNPNIPGHSVVNAINMSVSEEIPLAGVPFTLTYSSDRIRPGQSFNPKKLGLGGWLPSIYKFADFAHGRIYQGANGVRFFNRYNDFDDTRIVFSQDGLTKDQFDAATGNLRKSSHYSSFMDISSFSYFDDGRISSAGLITAGAAAFKYTQSGGIISGYGPYVTKFELDAKGNLASVTNPLGETYRMTYDDRGLLTSFQKPGGQVSRMSYDKDGNLIRDEGDGGSFISLTKTSSNEGNVVEAKNALGQKSTFLTQQLNGGITMSTMTEPSGAVSKTASAFNGQGYITAYGSVYEANFKDDPNFGSNMPTVSSRFQVPNTNINLRVVQARSDNLHRPAGMTWYYDDRTTSYTFQNDAKRTYVTTFNRKANSEVSKTPSGRTIKIQLVDRHFLPSTVAVGTIAPVKFEYWGDKVSSVSQNGVVLLKNTYDQNQFLNSVTDAFGRQTQFSYDLAARVTGITLPDQAKIAMTYDPNGNLSSITPPGKASHSFGYNVFGLVGKYLPPSINAKISGATIYDYNVNKQVTSVTRADGAKISLNYDPASSFLTSLNTPLGAYKIDYVPKTDLIQSIQTPDAQNISYKYAANYPLQVATSGEFNSVLKLDYNADATVASYSVSDSSGVPTKVGFAYDLDMLPVGVGNLKLTRNDFAAVNATTLGKVMSAIKYDVTGKLVSDSYSNGKAALYSLSSTLDKVGRIASKTETLGSAKLSSQFEYDLQGRLVKATSNGVTRTYTYDANGNRLKYTSGTTSYVGTYDEQDRLVSYGNSKFEYNDNGDLLLRTDLNPATKEEKVTSYTYDVFGNLRSVKLPDGGVIDYVIDGLNRRVGKKINGKLVQGFIYLNQLQIAAEVDGTGRISKTFVYGTKVNVPDYVNYNGKQYRIISDQVGTPKMIVDSVTGSVVEQFSYDEFGNNLDGKVSAIIPFGFAGGINDSDTGLVRFGARDYSPVIGRWTNKDPIGFAGGQGNLYAYVGNDPVNFIDPSGHFGLAGALIGGAFGAASGYLGALIADPKAKPEQIWNSVLTGALTGAAVGSGAWLGEVLVGGGVATAIGGGLGGFGGSALGQRYFQGKIDWAAAGLSGIFGSLGVAGSGALTTGMLPSAAAAVDIGVSTALMPMELGLGAIPGNSVCH
ncbi:RHS repeat domain-containing protein [Bdellovibrio sp. NC01]|uniref:RHS repeat domain-containing protein n=1 Tax=Bdellovibrio sp. NC01 TaxID=2220073 RepID=UPI001158E785|nr:RHS repeat-associated core domain-containing protein [Bdellovibrio sp. NC01]QDK37959.1 hypothetical protein DOE51_10350 [Bdellovibrio sp. NC01]